MPQQVHLNVIVAVAISKCTSEQEDLIASTAGDTVGTTLKGLWLMDKAMLKEGLWNCGQWMCPGWKQGQREESIAI